MSSCVEEFLDVCDEAVDDVVDEAVDEAVDDVDFYNGGKR